MSFTGGPLPDPFRSGLTAVYRTEDEAIAAAAHGDELYGRLVIVEAL
jgi:hypothetical protein